MPSGRIGRGLCDLQRSNIGLNAKEAVAAGWYFIGNINTDFDSYWLQLANGPASSIQNNERTLANQTANGDSSRAGQFDNTQGFVGVSSAVFGALTVGRLNSFSADLVSAYDPILGSYAFSLIGNSAIYVSGVGDTETTRYESAVKYAWSGNGYRAGAVWQFGGYSLGNGSNCAVQVGVGADFGALSIDGVYSYARDAASLSLYGANPLPNGVGPDDLKATLADINGGILAAKYRAGDWTLYGGYEYAVFSPPSDAFASGFHSLGGYTVLPGAVNATAYVNNEHLQVAWGGARYALRSDFDITGAYYIAHQNDDAPSTAKPGVCVAKTVPAVLGATPAGNIEYILRRQSSGRFRLARLPTLQAHRRLRGRDVFGRLGRDCERIHSQRQLRPDSWSSLQLLSCVVRQVQVGGDVPAGLIDEQHSVGSWSDIKRDFLEIQLHSRSVAKWQERVSAVRVVFEDFGRALTSTRRRWTLESI